MNGVNAFGATALHLAGEFNSVGVMELLVSAGAGLDAPNGDGWSPLMDAAFSGSIPAMELLQHWAYYVPDLWPGLIYGSHRQSLRTNASAPRESPAPKNHCPVSVA
eukprot:COSAG06_NODE_33889_length_482_cov_13.950392_1_plen_105_part_01